MWSENDLLTGAPGLAGPEIDAETVASSQALRAMLSEYLEGEAATGVAIKALLRKKAVVMKQTDPWCAVEEGFFQSMTGEYAMKRLQKLCPESLPASHRHFTVAEALAGLMAIAESPLMGFCGSAEKAVVTTVRS